MISAKNIIFDLGGVILNIDYQRSIDAFKSLGIDNFESRYTQTNQSSLFDDFETGKIKEAAFFDGIRNMTDKSLTDTQIRDAWNSMLLNLPLRRLQILQQLQLHFNIFLLSNTNSIHQTAFEDILKKQCGFSSFGVFFDKVYYSHHVGMRKPNAEIFEKILIDNSLKAQDTLFIDDSEQHITAAAALGLQTLYLSPAMTIEADVFLPKGK